MTFTITADELPRFMACNGSRLLAGEIPPNSDTSARDEGTAAHYMAVQAFRGQLTVNELVDRKAPNGVFMTEAMAEHVSAYLDVVKGTYQFADMEVDTTHDNSPVWVVRGRSDFVGITSSTNTLHITDFKYGWRIVEPQNHWTLISHAIAAVQRLQTQFIIENIELSIYQPRPYHPDGALRTWPVSIHELARLRRILSGTLSEPSDLTTTGNHCNKCHALTNCHNARMAEMNAIDQSEIVFYDTITDKQLSITLDTLNRAADMMKSRLEAFEELAKHRLKTGKVVDNYALDIGYGHSKWKEGFTADTLKAMTGVDLSSPKLVTPAEAKRRGVNEIFIKAATERPVTGIKLKRVTADEKAKRILGPK